jgi:DNA-binding beta-propeller fold protein YncE
VHGALRDDLGRGNNRTAAHVARQPARHATTNDRIVKFSKDGKFISAWGKHGKAQGEFDTPHGIALDSQGRVFVADRANNRIQIFDPTGKFIAEWKQFGRPSDVAIDKNDTIYVASGLQAGIRRLNVGSIGTVAGSLTPGKQRRRDRTGWPRRMGKRTAWRRLHAFWLCRR